MSTAKKNVKHFILQGNMTKRGNMAKEITVYRFQHPSPTNPVVLSFCVNQDRYSGAQKKWPLCKKSEPLCKKNDPCAKKMNPCAKKMSLANLLNIFRNFRIFCI